MFRIQWRSTARLQVLLAARVVEQDGSGVMGGRSFGLCDAAPAVQV